MLLGMEEIQETQRHDAGVMDDHEKNEALLQSIDHAWADTHIS